VNDVRAFEALLAGCASERIHSPGSVQPHGSLLGIDRDGRIVVASANSQSILGLDGAALLGQPLELAFGAAFASEVMGATDGKVLAVDGPSGSLDVITRRTDGLRLLELEPAPAAVVETRSTIYEALRAFHGATTLDDLAAQAVRSVQELTGFDRVLMYRFDPDWNGEVIAEVVGPDHQQFIGLRFPASDIPPQARALYSRARLRLIPDAEALPSPLLALGEVAPEEIDLSEVSLRAVSPVHLQYLQNMRVTASMSVAVHVGDHLWGLVACHHLTGPLRPSQQVRDAVDIVGRTTSTILAAFLGEALAQTQVALLGRVDAISESLWAQRHRNPDDALGELGVSLTDVFDATGGAVVGGGRIRCVGACPPEHMVADLVVRAGESTPRGLCVEELGALDAGWAKYADVAAGAMVVPVDADADRWLVWFRRETRSVVRWGGNPQGKDVATGENGRLRLDPRSSFDEYLELVRGRSAPWTSEERHAAGTLAHRVALVHAERIQRNAETAAVIQRTILLEQFPSIPKVDGAALYRPSSGNPIGGDWYDVFFGREGRAILAIGDVAGHGVEAAATMAQLRHALRAYVLREDTLAEAMSRLNDLMMSLLPTEIATSLLIDLDPINHVVEIVNAGHPPPIIIGDGEARYVDGERDLLIGVRRGIGYGSTRVRLPPGSTLIAYTDGLIERRTRTIDVGLAELRHAASSLTDATVDEICDRLLQLASDSDVDDDITIVAIRFIDEEPV
jgi:chemotaxis family two-component system sensor kinase Cph1